MVSHGNTAGAAGSTASGAPSPTIDIGSLVDRAGLWPARVVWFLTPLVAGPTLGPGLERFEGGGGAVAEVWLWVLWFVGLVAVLVPATQSLTIVRILAPLVLVVVIVAGVAGGSGLGLAGAIGFGAGLNGVVFSPITGDRMVNGSAYGSERRMALRPPGFALLGPIQLAWVLAATGLMAGPWLVAANHHLLGASAVVIGAAGVWAGFRVLHQLARRWLVFVPAGFVIHDHVSLVESVLMRRSIVTALGPASEPLDEAATDLTGGAYGLALEAVLSEPVRFGRRVERQVVDTSSSRLVLSPSLPGAALSEARVRAVPIGSID
jgi:hypothetical protein